MNDLYRLAVWGWQRLCCPILLLFDQRFFEWISAKVLILASRYIKVSCSGRTHNDLTGLTAPKKSATDHEDRYDRDKHKKCRLYFFNHFGS